MQISGEKSGECRIRVLLAPISSFAEWNSGGGFLSSVANNPWFIAESTPVAKYCIIIDNYNFGASETIVRNALNKALNYWKSELLTNKMEQNTITVGPKQFIEETCSDNTDIKFQFGILDETQIQKKDNPRVFIAAAIMTNYDKENLRGRGFIYVSPENGSLSLDRQEIFSNRWSTNNGRLLELTLVHELGHAFRVPHETSDFMNEKFLDKSVVNPLRASGMAFTSITPNIFSIPKSGIYQNCVPTNQADRCKKLEFFDEGRRFIISQGDSWG